MNPARNSKRYYENTKLLVIDGDKIAHSKVERLADFLRTGDLVVINRSATLPSSFRGVHERSGNKMEIRLAAFQGQDVHDFTTWAAIAFDNGSWKTPTEDRLAPPHLEDGDRIVIAGDLVARVAKVDTQHNRLFHLKFESSNLLQNLYRYGSPIQYSYLNEEVAVWDQQTIFSGPPISVEPASAGFQFTWKLFLELRSCGVEFASILHGAGIASSGDEELDFKLPLAEWFEVSEETARKVNEVKMRGGRVIALGTTVARALESAFNGKVLVPKSGLTTLKLGPRNSPKLVDALFTGIHEPKSSHLKLVESFNSPQDVKRGYAEAERLNYRIHEFGDLSFVGTGR